MSRPSDRAAALLDNPDLTAQLAGLPGSAWTSLLLEVAAARADQRSPADVLAQHLRDGFARPSAVDQRLLHKVDGALLDGLPAGFEAVELSPVAPLATVSAVALAHQNKVLSAHRSLEVVSDPTNVLALIAAGRRREGPGPVRLFTNHRTLRTPRYAADPLSWQHFRMGAWLSAGRDPGGRRFEADTLALHLQALTGAVDALRSLGLHLGALRWRFEVEEAHRSWVEPLVRAQAVEGAVISTLEPGYYRWLRIGLDTQLDGAWVNLGDGGFTDWLAALCSSRKERVFISALGTERLAAMLAHPESP